MEQEGTLVKLLKDCLTGADNKTFDQGRILTFTSMVVYYVLCFIHPDWSAAETAGGISAILVAGGVNLNLKKDTEPKNQ